MESANPRAAPDNKQAVLSLFAERLRYWRKTRGLSRKELAEKIGVSEITLATYEFGRKAAGIDKLKALADALGVTANELLGDGNVDDMGLDQCVRIANALGFSVQPFDEFVAIRYWKDGKPFVDNMSKDEFANKMEILMYYSLAHPKVRKDAANLLFWRNTHDDES